MIFSIYEIEANLKFHEIWSSLLNDLPRNKKTSKKYISKSTGSINYRYKSALWSNESSPSWAKNFFEISGINQPTIKNKSYSAIILLGIGKPEKIYALCWGKGYRKVSDLCKKRFGVTIASKLIDESSVISASAVGLSPSGRSVTARNFIPTSLENLRIIDDEERYNEISGKFSIGLKNLTVAGRDSLKIALQPNMNELVDFISSAQTNSSSISNIITKFKLASHDELIEIRNNFNQYLSHHRNSILLFPLVEPHLVEELRLRLIFGEKFKTNFGKHSSIQFQIWNNICNLNINYHNLNKWKIEYIDPISGVHHRVSLANHLMLNIKIKDKLYSLNDKEWIEIPSDALERVNKALSDISIYTPE